MESRELKFRAWDDDREEMIYDLSQCTTILWNNDEAMFVVANDQRNGDWNELAVMQFTGMRDKNRKDIYEHDLGRYSTGAVFKMVWYRGAWMWERVSGAYSYPIPYNTMDDFEVIGNIHEHPHLLSGGN